MEHYLISVADRVKRHCPACATERDIFLTFNDQTNELLVCCCVCQRILKGFNQ